MLSCDAMPSPQSCVQLQSGLLMSTTLDIRGYVIQSDYFPCGVKVLSVRREKCSKCGTKPNTKTG